MPAGPHYGPAWRSKCDAPILVTTRTKGHDKHGQRWNGWVLTSRGSGLPSLNRQAARLAPGRLSSSSTATGVLAWSGQRCSAWSSVLIRRTGTANHKANSICRQPELKGAPRDSPIRAHSSHRDRVVRLLLWEDTMTWPEAFAIVGVAFATGASIAAVVWACVFESTQKQHTEALREVHKPRAPFPLWKTKTTPVKRGGS